MYDFEKCADLVLNCVDGEMYNFAKKELDKLESDILDSLQYFNKKYYKVGFSDALDIKAVKRRENSCYMLNDCYLFDII